MGVAFIITRAQGGMAHNTGPWKETLARECGETRVAINPIMLLQIKEIRDQAVENPMMLFKGPLCLICLTFLG
jgi:hypothetical protein